jgi:CHAT domain-containing protein
MPKSEVRAALRSGDETRFYEGMGGRTEGAQKMRFAAALGEARLAVPLQKRWLDPYYGAGFVLQGEWR